MIGAAGLVLVPVAAFAAVWHWGSPAAPKVTKIGIIQVNQVLGKVPDGLKDGMKQLGYAEGKDVVYDLKVWNDDPSKIDGIVQSLIDDHVDILYAITNPSALSAQKIVKASGKNIPVVFVGINQPVELGLVASLTSSGNNFTGLTRNSQDFADLAERFAGSRRVICPDYRGRGRSAYDADWRNYDPMTYLNDIAHILTATGIHRFVAIGTSLGGLLAMGLAVTRPTGIAAAVINDIGPDVDPEGLTRGRYR